MNRMFAVFITGAFSGAAIALSLSPSARRAARQALESSQKDLSRRAAALKSTISREVDAVESMAAGAMSVPVPELVSTQD